MSNDLKRAYNAEANRFVPNVVIKEGGREISADLFSSLLRERIILLEGPIDGALSSLIIGQLQYLDATAPGKEISLYVNSPGGSIAAGLAIYDTMRNILSPVRTIGMGMCASMGSFLLSAGTPGRRVVLPNTEILVHQPRTRGGGEGVTTADDHDLGARSIKNTRRRMEFLYAHFMGIPYEEFDLLLKQLTKHDTILNPVMGKELGLIDDIMPPRALQPEEAKKLSPADASALKTEFDKIMYLNQLELDEVCALPADDPMHAIKKVIDARKAKLASTAPTLS